MTAWRATASRKTRKPAAFVGSPARLEIAKARSGSVDDDGDRVIIIMILLVGIIRPVQAIVRHETWGAEATLGLLMTVFAARALVVQALLRWVDRRRQRRAGPSV